MISGVVTCPSRPAHLFGERHAVATSISSTASDAHLGRGWVPHGPRSSLERGQFALLVLTIGAWALTIYQAQTMDMPMGVVPRIASSASDMTTSAEEMGDMTMVDAT
jgi:hypothetical protein